MNKFADNVGAALLLGDIQVARDGAVITSEYVNAALYDLLVFLLPNGGLGADIYWQLRQATQDADAGGDVKNIVGKTAIAVNGTDENTMQVIELRAAELDVDGSFHWVQVYAADPGGKQEFTYTAVIALGMNARYARSVMPDMEVASAVA